MVIPLWYTLELIHIIRWSFMLNAHVLFSCVVHLCMLVGYGYLYQPSLFWVKP